jgi:hypothetical protein
MALIGIKELPKDLTASETKVLMSGSHGNDHAFDKGTFYPKQSGSNIIGYFVAEAGCTLSHPDHGNADGTAALRVANIPDGIYEVRRQNEETHDAFRPVVD